MASVGYATLQVIPSMRGIRGRLQTELGGQASQAAKSAGTQAGGVLSAALAGALKLAPIAAAGAAMGVALTKGWQRLTAIENATAKLSGLGHSAQSVEKILGNALDTVKGTAFGLGDAATVAASAVAAGIQPGKDLRRTLGLIADTATIAGAPLGEIGRIFNQVAATGKLFTGDMYQLSDRGIPILQMVAKELGVTSAQAAKMVSEGKVSFDIFRNAIEKNIAGAALKSGETTQGSFANMQAAMGRLGAAMLGGVFPLAKLVFGALTVWIDKATDAVKPLGDALGKFFLSNEGPVQQFISGFKMSREEAAKLGDKLDGLAAVGVKVRDFVTGVTDKIAQFREGFKMSRSEIAQLGGPLEGATAAGHKFKVMLDQVVQGVKDFTAGWKIGDAGKDLEGMAGAGQKAREVFGDSWDKIESIFGKLATAAKDLAPAIGSIALSLGEASASIGISTWDLLLTTADALATVLNTVLVPAIEALAGWMEDHQTTVTLLVGAYTAYKIGVIAVGTATKVTAAITAAYRAVTIGMTAASYGAAGATYAQGAALRVYQVAVVATTVKTKAASAAQAAWNAVLAGSRWAWAGAQMVALKAKTLALAAASKTAAVGQRMLNAAVAAGQWAAQTAKLVAYKAVQLAISAATKVWTGVQWLLNLAMNANPLGLIVVGVMLLVGAVVLAYKKSETFRNIVDGAFRAVGAAAKWLWENAIKPAWENIKRGLAVVGAAVTWWWKNVVTKAFNGVIAVAKWLWGKIVAYFGFWKGLFSKVGGWIVSFKDSAVAKFRSFLDYVKGIPGKVTGFFSGLKDKLVTIGKNVVEGLRNGISNAWHLVLDKIDALVQKIPKKIRELLGIHSPSKVAARLMEFFGQGMVKGLLGSVKQVQSAADKLAKTVAGAFTGSKRQKLMSVIKADTKRLTSLAAQRDKAQAKLAEIVAGAKKVTADVSEKVRDSFKLLDGGEDGPISVKSVTDRLAGALAAAKKFAANMATLAKRGLSKDLMQQLAEAGPQAGGAMAEALANATAGELAELNKLSKQLGSVANSTGRTVADSLYGAGVSAGQGIVKGLQSQIKSIEAAMLKIARSMQKAIKKALGIKSPSRVMRHLMGYVGDGAALGLMDGVGPVTRAARRMADAAVVAPPPARVSHAELRAGRGRGQQPVVEQHFHIQRMDEREVAMMSARRIAAAAVG